MATKTTKTTKTKETVVGIIENLSERYPDLRISSIDVTKNNGVVLQGIQFQNESSNVAPVIYLEGIFEELKREGIEPSIEELAKKAGELYEGSLQEGIGIEGISADYMDWEKVRERVILELVNRDANKELLKKVPYKEVCDLAIVFKYLLPNDRRATILVRKEHLDRWGVSLGELYETALENSQRLCPVDMFSLAGLVSSVFGDDVPDNGMLIVSNKQKQNGAVAMLYPGTLQKIYEKIGDFCIIPSSIHEVLAMPMSLSVSEDVNEMIRDVNATTVDPNDVLSDHVYLYDSKTKSLTF